MIIGLCGVSGTGKSLIAERIHQTHGYLVIGLADHLKRFIQSTFGFTTEQLWGGSSCRNEIDSRHQIPARLPCRKLGFEWAQEWQYVWAQKLLDNVEFLKNQPGYNYDFERGIYPDPEQQWTFTDFVIPDVRSRADLQLLKQAGAKLVRVTRENHSSNDSPTIKAQAEIDDSEFDYILRNPGREKSELYGLISQMLSELRQ